ncbi:MAG: XRE family transcriptional regulator [Deferrisomatales bacterium]|nr:XRE family transcriptional regulator [Deferrisomatales bacterium]
MSGSTPAEGRQVGIGAKIRGLRKKRQYTLQDLAGKTGLSKEDLSLIERGEGEPPVAALMKISSALEVSISFLIQEGELEQDVAVTRVEDREKFSQRPHHGRGGPGYQYQSLEIHKPDKSMQPLMVTYDLMTREDMQFYSHDGEECVYVMEGEVEFRTPDRRITLNPGDCLYFNCQVPHAFRSLGQAPATAMHTVFTGGKG